MRTAAIVVLGVCVGCAAGCSRARQAPVAMARGTGPQQVFPASAPMAGRTVDKPETQEPGPPATRKLVRNANLRLEVDSVDAALAGVRAAVRDLAGYVSDQSQSDDAVRGRRASVTCRVPAEKLDALLGRLGQLGRAREVTIRTEDVTDQYFDLDTRLRNQKRLEARLTELLDRPGNKLPDLLEVERELARVRTTLDQLEGRQRAWDSQVAFSAVAIAIDGPRPSLAAEEGGIWSSLKNAVHEAGENAVMFSAGSIAALGWIVPLALVLAAALWIARRLWRLMRGHRAVKT